MRIKLGKSQKNNEGKSILRQLMKKYLPDKISTATKQGFSAPDSSWFKGESIDFVRKNCLQMMQKYINTWINPLLEE